MHDQSAPTKREQSQEQEQAQERLEEELAKSAQGHEEDPALAEDDGQ